MCQRLMWNGGKGRKGMEEKERGGLTEGETG